MNPEHSQPCFNHHQTEIFTTHKVNHQFERQDLTKNSNHANKLQFFCSSRSFLLPIFPAHSALAVVVHIKCSVAWHYHHLSWAEEHDRRTSKHQSTTTAELERKNNTMKILTKTKRRRNLHNKMELNKNRENSLECSAKWYCRLGFALANSNQPASSQTFMPYLWMMNSQQVETASHWEFHWQATDTHTITANRQKSLKTCVSIRHRNSLVVVVVVGCLLFSYAELLYIPVAAFRSPVFFSFLFFPSASK